MGSPQFPLHPIALPLLPLFASSSSSTSFLLPNNFAIVEVAGFHKGEGPGEDVVLTGAMLDGTHMQLAVAEIKAEWELLPGTNSDFQRLPGSYKRDKHGNKLSKPNSGGSASTPKGGM